MDFAVEILYFRDGIKGRHSLIDHLERSATSVGASIREADCAQSKPDFVAKLQTALKQYFETPNGKQSEALDEYEGMINKIHSASETEAFSYGFGLEVRLMIGSDVPPMKDTA
ncbi:MAG: four helix bundle protein [Clostridia bacterium]|nr:four helix bundle protein [Clostridia bacterium]